MGRAGIADQSWLYCMLGTALTLQPCVGQLAKHRIFYYVYANAFCHLLNKRISID